jgi:hypothetical protein
VPRDREVVLRLRAPALRDFAAPADVAFAREVVDLRAPEVDDFARVARVLVPPAFAADERDEDEREPLDLRAPLREVERDEVELDPPLLLSSAVHFPDITRCAASATASAIKVPSLVALAITLLAACEAVSAASRPASRMARRAFGLALIAAAAAASPAASISLLIAALASFSTVSFFEEESEETLLEDLARADLAIASSPSVQAKDTSSL